MRGDGNDDYRHEDEQVWFYYIECITNLQWIPIIREFNERLVQIYSEFPFLLFSSRQSIYFQLARSYFFPAHTITATAYIDVPACLNDILLAVILYVCFMFVFVAI
jgi:hypothetical protein